MTKLGLESGLVQARADRYELTGPLPVLAIPTTLRDALMARLDRLTTAKAVAQLGATLGRTFSYDLLHPEILLEAHRALGGTSFFLGQFAAAQTHMEQGLTLYHSQQHRSHTFLYSQNLKGQCLAVLAWSQWVCGYPDQARQRSDELLAFTQELATPHDLTYALTVAAALQQFRREAQVVQARAEAAMALATEHGFALWRAYATILRGWALAMQGQEAEGITHIRQGLVAFQATGAAWWQPYFLALLAEAYGTARQTEEALDVLTEALTTVQKTGERLYEAELQRLSGELLLTQGCAEHKWEEAEQRFVEALTIARRQQAKSWELRAAVSLARLWQRQGKHAEARQLLAEVYGWFTEGFDTADLQEARTLLDTLGA
jgi:predicted ATPase